MEIPSFYRGLNPTQHDKTTFESLYKELKTRILEEKPELSGRNNVRKLNKEIFQEIGFPYWKPNGDVAKLGEGEFFVMNGGKARLRNKRLASNGKAISKRQRWIDNANNLQDPNKVEAGQEKIKQIQKVKNRTADHDLEVQEFGPVLDQLEEEYKAGAITEEEYLRRKQIYIDSNAGDVEANITDRHWAVNEKKRKEVNAKQTALETMETNNPSARHMDPRYRDAMTRRRAKMNNATNYTGLQVWSRQNGHNLDALKSGSLRKVDQYSNILFNAATGNYGGAALGAGFLGGSELLKDPKFQARIGGQIADLIGKRGKKTALKMIPGLDVVLSGQETLSYLRQGRLDQAGIALLSGAIGWIPVIGDAISASLDLTNTGLDIARLNFTNTVNRTGQPEIDPKTGRVFKI